MKRSSGLSAMKRNIISLCFIHATPGTPLYEEIKEKGMLLDESEIELADVHGQYRFNFRHPNIKNGQETAFLLRAFHRDFEMNGPSVMRTIAYIDERMDEVQESSRSADSKAICEGNGKNAEFITPERSGRPGAGLRTTPGWRKKRRILRGHLQGVRFQVAFRSSCRWRNYPTSPSKGGKTPREWLCLQPDRFCETSIKGAVPNNEGGIIALKRPYLPLYVTPP